MRPGVLGVLSMPCTVAPQIRRCTDSGGGGGDLTGVNGGMGLRMWATVGRDVPSGK